MASLIWHAIDASNRLVAIKTLPSHLAKDPSIRERFLREAARQAVLFRAVSHRLSLTGRDQIIDVSIRAWPPSRPHNALPDLPPSVEVETKAVLKQCNPVRAAVAELRQAAELIPNQSLLIGTLPLLEAGAGSEIENIARPQTDYSST